MICGCQGTRCGLQTEFWSFQAREAGNPMGWQGEESCWLLGERACGSNTWPAFCQSIKRTWCFPESGVFEEQAISGLKEAPRDLLRVTTMYLFPATECRKGKWEGGWTGVCSTCRACFGVWKAKNAIKTSSWRLKMWFRNGTIYQTEAKDRSKYAV